MQRTLDSINTVRWQPGAAPVAACVLQAVLLSAAVSVLFQSLANVFLDIPSVFLHLGSFLVVFPFVWKWQVHNRLGLAGTDLFQWVCFDPHAIEGQLKYDGKVVRLEVVEMGRFWGALLLRLKPTSSALNSPAASVIGKPVAITVWKSIIGQEKFRRLAVLATWHARRCP